MKLLLDTCTFLWLTLDSPRLSANAIRQFSDPENDVFLSVVSVWEIAVKYSIKKLRLPANPGRFVPAARISHGIDSLPLDEGAALVLARIPDHHGDPFDRMLVCQALAHGLAILTCDEQIARYPIQTVW